MSEGIENELGKGLINAQDRECLESGVDMGAIVIGRVKSGKGKSYEVKWDQSSKDVYVSWAGWSHVGKASSAGEAMTIAEAWLYNK